MPALNQLKVGSVGVVEELDLPDEVQHHLMHMGLVPEARVRAVRRAPTGDPTVYAIDGFEIALRQETARGILISVKDAADIVPTHATRGLARWIKNGKARAAARREAIA